MLIVLIEEVTDKVLKGSLNILLNSDLMAC